MVSFADAEACAPFPDHHGAAPPRITSKIAAVRLIASFIAPPSKHSLAA
jgi:hypothetical protein